MVSVSSFRATSHSWRMSLQAEVTQKSSVLPYCRKLWPALWFLLQQVGPRGKLWITGSRGRSKGQGFSRLHWNYISVLHHYRHCLIYFVRISIMLTYHCIYERLKELASFMSITISLFTQLKLSLHIFSANMVPSS